MQRYMGLLGIVFILGLAFLLSNNRRAINKKLVIVGLLLQVGLAFFVLRIPLGQMVFQKLGAFVTAILNFSDKGADFVFGVLVSKDKLDLVFGEGNSFIFFFKVIPTIIFVSVLVSISYHFGIMQRIVSFIARIVHYLMGVSGSEALSNVGSAFVGQVEAQIMIRPYVNSMTMSELLASMSGSMACIAGGVMAVYISMGVPADYLIAASIMAAPGALVISKIVWPETEESPTQGTVKLEVKKTHVNLMDAISHGASDGMKISINVVAMLIGFIALIAMLDAGFGWLGLLMDRYAISLSFIGLDVKHLSLTNILGVIFSLFAWLMGVPPNDIQQVGSLMGTKMVVNEFVAYFKLAPLISQHALSPKSVTIATFALCGFANFSSIAIQVGGIGELAPGRRADLAKLGFTALICGTLASYMSATLAGMMV